MRKLLAIFLILAMLTASFIACDSETESNGDNANENSANEDASSDTVTKDQWKKAFIFSDVKSFTIKNVEKYLEGSVERHNETIEGKYCETTFLYTKTGTTDGVSKKETHLGEVDEPTDIFHDWTIEFMRELDDFDDFGYSLFKFSNETNSYSANIEIDGTDCNVTVAFKDQKISKITITGKEDGETFEGVTEIWDYNTTKFTDAIKLLTWLMQIIGKRHSISPISTTLPSTELRSKTTKLQQYTENTKMEPSRELVQIVKVTTTKAKTSQWK